MRTTTIIALFCAAFVIATSSPADADGAVRTQLVQAEGDPEHPQRAWFLPAGPTVGDPEYPEGVQAGRTSEGDPEHPHRQWLVLFSGDPEFPSAPGLTALLWALFAAVR